MSRSPKVAVLLSGCGHLDGAEIAVFKESADEPACASPDHDRVRLGPGLQPSGQVRRFTDHRLFPCRSFADRIADHYEPAHEHIVEAADDYWVVQT